MRTIEFLGELVLIAAIIRALVALGGGRLSNPALTRAGLLLASGIVGALGLMTAATLLKTIELRSWSAIGMFAVVLALRTLVKQALTAELESKQRQPSL
ncbi:MAG TPA: hypothetical protein VM913_02140 [Sphingomicrobium sp.]|nr:hypothetical protein [Sphingomicrobium sp.]